VAAESRRWDWAAGWAAAGWVTAERVTAAGLGSAAAGGEAGGSAIGGGGDGLWLGSSDFGLGGRQRDWAVRQRRVGLFGGGLDVVGVGGVGKWKPAWGGLAGTQHSNMRRLALRDGGELGLGGGDNKLGQGG